jgi:hypothetical protein
VDPLVVFFGGFLLLFFVGVIALGIWHPRSARDIVGGSLRSDAAQAEIESHDIDEMIDARNERRRRLGQPEIGDELEQQVRRDPR